jgi:hypothetical protein
VNGAGIVARTWLLTRNWAAIFMFGCVLWWNVCELRQKNMQKENEKQRMRLRKGWALCVMGTGFGGILGSDQVHGRTCL